MNTVAVWAFNAPVSVFHNTGDYTLGGAVGRAAVGALTFTPEKRFWYLPVSHFVTRRLVLEALRNLLHGSTVFTRYCFEKRQNYSLRSFLEREEKGDAHSPSQIGGRPWICFQI